MESSEVVVFVRPRQVGVAVPFVVARSRRGWGLAACWPPAAPPGSAPPSSSSSCSWSWVGTATEEAQRGVILACHGPPPHTECRYLCCRLSPSAAAEAEAEAEEEAPAVVLSKVVSAESAGEGCREALRRLGLAGSEADTGCGSGPGSLLSGADVAAVLSHWLLFLHERLRGAPAVSMRFRCGCVVGPDAPFITVRVAVVFAAVDESGLELEYDSSASSCSSSSSSSNSGDKDTLARLKLPNMASDNGSEPGVVIQLECSFESRKSVAHPIPALVSLTSSPTATCNVYQEPGSITTADFRIHGQPSGIGSIGGIRVVQWNIERGYKLPGIIEQLSMLNADIIFLQEVDKDCERSNSADVGKEIASALHMNYLFVCEFDELRSPLRSKATQGGGVHGNAILSRYDLRDVRVVPHTCQPVNWDTEGALYNEPRRGKRYILSAVAVTPVGDVLCYCVHFEVFCGLMARIAQLSDLFKLARQSLKEYPMQIIGGDFNTMGHTLARLSPKYCRDKMRWWSIGKTEAQWLDQNVLKVTQGPNQNLVYWGFPADVCREAWNPGFTEHFDVYNDVTLHNYWGYFQGKLDWVLLSHLSPIGKLMGNHDYTASDHKWLLLELVPQHHKES
ncbi:endonuclease/exonuclease/phosphatase family metal-dependent hydrolase [Pelomyxa schiedti]|nr:endonuclease/exonuclease/phosphatase family metal-dependent hydrolase [Pelomyxa schiedti]